MNKYLDGEKAFLYFYETQDYDAIAGKLIEILSLPYNTAGKSHEQGKDSTFMKKGYAEGGVSTMTNIDKIVKGHNAI